MHAIPGRGEHTREAQYATASLDVGRHIRSEGGEFQPLGLGPQQTLPLICLQSPQVHLIARHAPSDPHRLIRIREIGIDERSDRAVVLQDLVEEHLGPAHHAVADQLTPDMPHITHHDGRRLAVAQPLAGEVLDEPLRLGVTDHANDFGIQDIRMLEPAGGRKLQQARIRHAAPQEIRQPASEAVVVQCA